MLSARHGDGTAPVVGRHLAHLLGHDAYPSGGLPTRSAGPFAVVGAWHASGRATITMGPHGATMAATGGAPADLGRAGQRDDRPADDGWVAQLSAGAMAARTAAALRAPWRLNASLARGQSLTDAAYGPNRVAGTSLASLWWFHADALAQGLPDPGQLGAAAIALIETHLDSAAAVGTHGNALNKAGALVAETNVLVVWSGNRLCRAGDEGSHGF